MRRLVTTTLGVVVAGSLAAPAAAAVPVPREARAVDTSRPDRWVGTGTARSCSSRAVVRPVAKGGLIPDGNDFRDGFETDPGIFFLGREQIVVD